MEGVHAKRSKVERHTRRRTVRLPRKGDASKEGERSDKWG